MEPTLVSLIIEKYGWSGICLIILFLIIKYGLSAFTKAAETFERTLATMMTRFESEISLERAERHLDRDMRHQHSEQLLAVIRAEQKVSRHTTPQPNC